MSRGRVLVLEDDIALRGLLQEVLTLEDFEVIVCDSFDDVRSAAAAERGDIIVADFWGGPQRSLSDTGLFGDTAKHQPAPGVVPFAITAEQWIDHASAESPT